MLLTIQVDSISKRGENDALIPANVAEAINFYQPNGLLHGQAQIRAADRIVAAARAERLPSLSLSADSGVIGLNPPQSHGT